MSDRIKTVQQCADAGLMTAAPSEALRQVEEAFSIAITDEMVNVSIDEPGVAQQFVPSEQELNIAAQELADPIGDQAFSPVTGVVHRHRDRCLLMPVKVCAVYCRFCFRREKIGPGQAAMSPQQLEQAYSYISEHPEIWEVILTGGDPMILKPKMLDQILSRLRAIDHVKVLRLHTRIPVVDSARINADMLAVLKKHAPLYCVIHTNHASEFHQQAKQACRELLRAGVVLLSQSVLLKGINDDVAVLADLMRLLVELGIKPYYIHQLDHARGTGHFRVSVERGKEIMRQLRQQLSGLCQPVYVVDEPGGTGGKSPLV